MSYQKDKFVEFKEIEIGIDSDSGLAVSVKIDEEWHWIPYSQIEEIDRDPRSQRNDRVVMSRWIAGKKGLL